MDFADLVREASKGDVNAFVTLTRRFQHLAFGSALALVQDFQVAEDVTQDAFLAAWSALPRLSDPAAFPGWLRSVVRHHAFRVLRRRQLNLVPLTEAAAVASDEPAADRVLDLRHQYGSRSTPSLACHQNCGSRPRFSTSMTARIRISRRSSPCL